MPRTQAAKDLAAKQKAELKAIKERKKNSDNPDDWGTWRKLREGFKATAQIDPKLKTLTFTTMGVSIVVFTVIGVLVGIVAEWGWWWIPLFVMLGVMIGLYIAVYLLQSRAKKAAFTKYKGQAGVAELALQELDKKKWRYTPAIAFNKQQDVVHRAVGPAGLFLIGEGEPGRLKQLMATEVKRHEQVAYGVTCQTLMAGDKPGQIKLENLSKHLSKLPKQWDATKIDEVSRRLQALDAIRQRLPLPKGPMPTGKGASRSAMRGR